MTTEAKSKQTSSFRPKRQAMGKHSFKTMTSLGSCLSSDDMIVEKLEEEEEVKHQTSIASNNANLPKLGAEFKKQSKEAVDFLILKTRFSEQTDRKTLFKRRDDWIKDLNMNLVKGKVVKSTHYFD